MVVPTGWLPELAIGGFSRVRPPRLCFACWVRAAACDVFPGILKVENQNPLNSCVGHRLSSGLECPAYSAVAGQVQLSRMFAYIAAPLDGD